jgi:hypothetical protein
MAGPIVAHLSRDGRFDHLIGGVTLFLALRFAAAALIGAGAGWIVLARRPKDSLPSILQAAIFTGVLAGVLVAGWKLHPQAASWGPFPHTLATLAFGVLVLGLLAGAVHCSIRAFEFGRLRDNPPPPAKAARPTS